MINQLKENNQQSAAQVEEPKQIEILKQELRQSRDILLRIEEFSAELGILQKPKKVYHNCLKLFKNLLDLHYVTLFLTGEKPDTLVICDTIGFPQTMVGEFTISSGTGLPSIVYETKEVETIEDFDTETRIAIPEIIYQEKIRSAIAVPMLQNNKLFGVLIGHTLDRRDFSEEEKGLARIFGNQAATAIKNSTYIQSISISEEKLLRRSSELESIFQNSMAGIMLLKGNRVIARCNHRLAEILGYDSAEEMKGLGMLAFHNTQERYEESGKLFYDRIGVGKQVQMEYMLHKKDKTPIWCWLSGKAVDQSMPPDLNKGIVWVIDDLSYRKKIERQLLKNRTLESTSILTSGLAHDFNNIITAILGNLNLSMMELPAGDPLRTFLEPARDATLRAKELTHKLQTFSQNSRPNLAPASILEVIRETIFTYPAHENITIKHSTTEELWPAEFDQGQLTKVFENLLNNSVRAMPEGGQIRIKCSNFTNDNNQPDLRGTRYIKIRVSDTGRGIPPEHIEKIFDPYFTTRNRDATKGCGFGLATVQSIIKRHRGSIKVASTVGAGTTFTFYLPALGSENQEKTASPVAPSAPSTVRKKQILVMDDDRAVGEVTQQMLNLVGYEVSLAINGEEALKMYQEHLSAGQAFDIVIMDLHVPEGMGGLTAAKEIIDIDKNAKIIISSGDSEDNAVQNYQEYGFCGAVTKPFELKDLHHTLSLNLQQKTS